MGQDEVLAFLFYKRVIKNDDSFFSAEDIVSECYESNKCNARSAIKKLDSGHYLERKTITTKNVQRHFEYRLDLLYERQVELMLEYNKLRGRDYAEQWSSRTSNTNRTKLCKDTSGVITVEHNKCSPLSKQRTSTYY